MARAPKLRSTFFSVFLFFLGALCLVIHFEIYRSTAASIFVNQPEFYYNRFVVRDSSGQSVREVSLTTGFWSYTTAILSTVTLCWGMGRVAVAVKKSRAANRTASRR